MVAPRRNTDNASPWHLETPLSAQNHTDNVQQGVGPQANLPLGRKGRG
jgi:hypothetical protein